MSYKIITDKSQYGTWLEVVHPINNDELLKELLKLKYTKLLKLEVFGDDVCSLSEYIKKYFTISQQRSLRESIQDGIDRLQYKLDRF